VLIIYQICRLYSQFKWYSFWGAVHGQADQISDENMVTSEDKSRYEKRISTLEKDREKTNELIKELMRQVVELQKNIQKPATLPNPKNEQYQEGKCTYYIKHKY